MYPVGHFALGFICGMLIMLPFLRNRYIYDYDLQRWVPVKWAKVKKVKGYWVHINTKRRVEVATEELYPLTSPRVIITFLLFAYFCGFLAMLPDIGLLWGDHTTDDYWWADFFFYHYTIDNHTHAYIGKLEPFLILLAIAICISIIAFVSVEAGVRSSNLSSSR